MEGFFYWNQAGGGLVPFLPERRNMGFTSGELGAFESLMREGPSAVVYDSGLCCPLAVNGQSLGCAVTQPIHYRILWWGRSAAAVQGALRFQGRPRKNPGWRMGRTQARRLRAGQERGGGFIHSTLGILDKE